MKWGVSGVVLLVGMMSVCAIAQPAPKCAMQVTICDIVNHPLQFKGKLVQVRAQVWSDIYHDHQFWMNEASVDFEKVCYFLPAKFTAGTGLAGSAGFGTFIGRVVIDPVPFGFDVSSRRAVRSRVMLVIEKQSDIYGLRDYNGPIPILQLFDSRNNSFVRPQCDSLTCWPRIPKPAASASQ
jgi:hypothetical protein